MCNLRPHMQSITGPQELSGDRQARRPSLVPVPRQ